MTNIIKKPPSNSDEFEGCTDAVVGGDESSPDRGVPFIKFSGQAKWQFNEEELPQEREYMVAGVQRDAVHWPQESRPPVEGIKLASGEPWADTDAWNETNPKNEW